MNRRLFALLMVVALISSALTYALIPFVAVPEEPEKIEVNLAYQFGFHYGTHIIMDYFDLIEKYTNGTAIAIFHKISGGSAINEAIIAGSLQFGSMSPHASLKGIDKGIGTKIFVSMGCKVAELWTWRDDIQSVADFTEGDIINVVKIGSTQCVSLIKAYTDLGRTREEAEALFGYFSHADGYQLMEQKEIDAHFTGPPYTQFYAELGYHKIADEMTIWGTPLSGSSLIASVEFCEAHPDIAAAVMYAWIDATNFINNNPEEASRIIGVDYGYSAEESFELWQEADLIFNPTYGLDTVDELARVMYELGLLSNLLTEEDILFEQTRGLIGH